MTSYFEAYACAIQEQELGTKDLISQRNKKVGVHTNNHCGLCRIQVQDVFHIISSCSRMSTLLPSFKTWYDSEICIWTTPYEISTWWKVEYPADEFIHSKGNIEYWWNLSIKTAIKTKNNKPNLIIWNNEVKTCQVVEFSCPADINVFKKVSEKETMYGPLIHCMQLLYPDNKFEFIPIIVRALGSITTSLLQVVLQINIPLLVTMPVRKEKKNHWSN